MEILDFYADWCGPCQMMKPTVEEFKELHPEIKVTAVNIDDEEELAEKYNVATIPCLVVLKDGEEIKRAEGAQSLKKLEKLVEG
ncbi:thioredoxin family protein [Candidatus Saccharibacteria bacterium]|nr:thioredoxin family protein [Candidatus Saccharibacteria bacterium]